MVKLAALAPDSIPVVSYARISADRKKDEHGVRDQHKINRKTAAKYGWTIVHEFTDNDKSAAKADVVRDDFEVMLKALVAGKLSDGTPIRGVVVWMDDRLVRRPGDYERFVDALTYNEGFVYADEQRQLDLYNEDVEAAGLMGAVQAKKEVRKIQRRVRRSHRRRAEEGTPVGGHRPFGWQADRVSLHPVEAPLLQRAARDFIGGRSLRSIVNEWIREGVKTPRGGDWKVHVLKDTLSNPRLCGWRRLGGELVRDDAGNPVVGQWEAILTPDEWVTVQAIFSTRNGRSVGKDGVPGEVLPADYREHRYLLTGILRCGRPKEDGVICNTKLRVAQRPELGHHVYHCPARSAGGCGGLSRRGDLVDMYVSEAVLAKLEEAEMRKRPISTVWPRETELKEAEAILSEHIAAFMSKPRKITAELFYRLLPDLERDVAELRAEKNKYEGAARAAQARTDINIADIRKRWYLPEAEGGLPLSRKRLYVREALVAVIVHPSGRTGRAPFNPDLLELIPREDV
ncbi:recombinase family protein [Sphaerisporangium fuscum]|uniref:recombinase family protein n=1 Tax=Sphaerisporangium fuscum TaxID=2835868 RepID=UPI001BDCA01B|nr:recombinase family protein [Sphaerisporangium fuscum]